MQFYDLLIRQKEIESRRHLRQIIEDGDNYWFHRAGLRTRWQKKRVRVNGICYVRVRWIVLGKVNP